jgi:hypothetical protein
MMEAYKLNGKIDATGHLILFESIPLNPGHVEVIILQTTANQKEPDSLETPPTKNSPNRPSKVKAFQDWFKNTEPASPNFEPEQARWEALKEKYEL